MSCRHSSQAQDAQPPIISTVRTLGAAPTDKPCTTAEPSANVAQVRRPVTPNVVANTGV
ncbi:hypothetical protein [Mycolicibacterium cosmeticum]|uniref:hypothetical protein n=1 Tax=Mycolicibacterium cosmeticum TaxID=258533 RepID=UPI00174E5F47|nr:hypothetical protein [Mycolicibacterium cosmeticum]